MSIHRGKWSLLCRPCDEVSSDARVRQCYKRICPWNGKDAVRGSWRDRAAVGKNPLWRRHNVVIIISGETGINVWCCRSKTQRPHRLAIHQLVGWWVILTSFWSLPWHDYFMRCTTVTPRIPPSGAMNWSEKYRHWPNMERRNLTSYALTGITIHRIRGATHALLPSFWLLVDGSPGWNGVTYNWGYGSAKLYQNDGSHATILYQPATRVKEFKQR